MPTPARTPRAATAALPEATADGAPMQAGLPVRSFPDAVSFEAWLAAQPPGSPGLWLQLAKKGSGVPCVGKPAAIEALLCHGWIDGQLQPRDALSWLVRCTPRKPRSNWSAVNRATALRLIADGRMAPAGLAQVQAAQADGRWNAAYAPQRLATVPPDLQQALDADPAAAAFFATLTGANRYAVLYRVQDAKTPATRARRIAQFVAMLARGEVLHPPNAKPGA
jgi:uncharacterized protein YdeI (YjbR/CyaY-like superfamily)